MRVVLDTNIFVSATIKPDTAPALVVQKFLHGKIEVLVSQKLLQELEESIFYLRSRKYSNLDLKEYKGVPIITVAQFLNLLENLP